MSVSVGDIDLDLDSMKVGSQQFHVEEPLEFSMNYIHRVRLLVNLILEQLSRIAEDDRKQMQTMKHEYREASKESSDLQRRIGNAAPWLAAFTVTMALSQFMWAHPDDRVMVKFASEQIPQAFGGLYNGRLQSKQMEWQSISSLRNTEIVNKGQQTGSSSNAKQEALTLFQNALEAEKRASSAN